MPEFPLTPVAEGVPGESRWSPATDDVMSKENVHKSWLVVIEAPVSLTVLDPGVLIDPPVQFVLALAGVARMTPAGRLTVSATLVTSDPVPLPIEIVTLATLPAFIVDGLSADMSAVNPVPAVAGVLVMTLTKPARIKSPTDRQGRSLRFGRCSPARMAPLSRGR